MVYEYDEDDSLRNRIQESRIKSIAQQMRCFGWSEFKRPVEWDDPCLVSEKPNDELQRMIHPIMMGLDHIRLIVKENMVVGVVLEDTVGYCHSGEDYYSLTEENYILPYHEYVYLSTSDNNGSGYKERDWHKYLICLPYNHNFW